MSSFKELSSADIKTSKSSLFQLVDVIQEDVSGSGNAHTSSTTRKKYQVFVTGGVGPGVTSSLFQTIYDQDHSLQTANQIFDVTIGVCSGTTTLPAAILQGVDSAGKLLCHSNSMMVREKVNIHRQFAQTLLGNAGYKFSVPYSTQTSVASPPTVGAINYPIFISFKRLFSRDRIKKETFAMKMYSSGVMTFRETQGSGGTLHQHRLTHNLVSPSGSMIITDIGGAATAPNQQSPGGTVGTLVDSTNTSNKVGLIFYDQGCVVLNAELVLSGAQNVSGTISAMNNKTAGGHLTTGTEFIGSYVPGGASSGPSDKHQGGSNRDAKYIPDFWMSGSIDNFVDHLMGCRFGTGTDTAITFQNETKINSTLYFCRATADEFNYSSNPSFTDAENRMVIIDSGQEDTQRTFSMVSSVGLYDANNNLLAVAKLSRPVEKNDEKDVTFRVRLDF